MVLGVLPATQLPMEAATLEAIQAARGDFDFHLFERDLADGGRVGALLMGENHERARENSRAKSTKEGVLNRFSKQGFEAYAPQKTWVGKWRFGQRDDFQIERTWQNIWEYWEQMSDIHQQAMSYGILAKTERSYWLEWGHTPDLHENLSRIWHFGFPLILVSLLLFNSFYLVREDLPKLIVTSTAICSLSIYYYLGEWLSGHLPHEMEGFQRLFPSSGVLFARNKTMARNIDSASHALENGEVLLVHSLGRAHIRGISYLLQTNYGFREVALQDQIP